MRDAMTPRQVDELWDLVDSKPRLREALTRLFNAYDYLDKQDKKRTSAYRDGIRAAASIVEMFDGKVDHPWRLSDVVLFKFNLLSKRKVRKVRGIDPEPGRIQFRTLPQRTVHADGSHPCLACRYCDAHGAHHTCPVCGSPNCGQEDCWKDGHCIDCDPSLSGPDTPKMPATARQRTRRPR